MVNVSNEARLGGDVTQRLRAGIGLFGRRIASSLIALSRQPQVQISRLLDGGYCPDGRPSSSGGHDGGGIDVENLSVAYGDRLAVEGLTGRFARASLTAVVGPNGAGKSSLLKSIAGILPPQTGSITCAAVAANRLAYLPQQAELNRDFPITVGELVTLGGWRNFGAFRRPPDALASGMMEAITTVGLQAFTDRPIADLSVGEFQRALFARLVLQDASIILLDEPFAAVDERTTDDLLQLVNHWHGEGRTIIAVLHDLDQVRGHFPSALLMARSCIAWGDTSSVLTKDNLALARKILGRSNNASAAP
jgi:zinc/manganese transport system ATP-binding protein